MKGGLNSQPTRIVSSSLLADPAMLTFVSSLIRELEFTDRFTIIHPSQRAVGLHRHAFRDESH